MDGLERDPQGGKGRKERKGGVIIFVNHQIHNWNVDWLRKEGKREGEGDRRKEECIQKEFCSKRSFFLFSDNKKGKLGGKGEKKGRGRQLVLCIYNCFSSCLIISMTSTKGRKSEKKEKRKRERRGESPPYSQQSFTLSTIYSGEGKREKEKKEERS